MFKLSTVALVASLALAGCAKKPEEISAADIGQGVYRNASCKQLADTLVKYSQNLENLSADQRSAASGDALGVFLLGMPLSSMSGNDKETTISVTKGHIQQITAERQAKRCPA